MRRALLALPVLSILLLAAGCGDSTGVSITPILVGDTVTIGAPTVPGNDEIPSAIDITGDGAGGVFGGRFPERPADALQWDFALRVRDGQLALLPAAVFTIGSRAALTPALQGQTFEGLREAPGQSAFITNEAVVLTEGAVYAARSRDAVSAFGTTCPQFAKIKAIEVNQTTGRVTLGILTNERCGDPRLVPTED